MRTALLACTAIVISACAQATTRSSADSPFKTGAYHFEDFQRGTNSRIKGTVTLLPDSATIELDDVYCQPIERLFRTDGAAVFHCEGGPVAGMRIVIDRHNPEQGSSWSGSSPTTSNTTSCSTYATTSTGERYCSRYQTESVDTQRTVGGQLRLAPIRP